MIETNVRGIRNTPSSLAIHIRVFNMHENSALELVAQSGELFIVLAVKTRFRQFGSLA